MNRSGLLTAIAKRMDIKVSEAENFLTAMLDEVSGALSRGDCVKLAHFGVFEIKHRRKHRAVNISTGQSYTMPGRKEVVFRSSSELKEMINSGGTEHEA